MPGPTINLGGTQLSFWYECRAQRAENRGSENGLLPNSGPWRTDSCPIWGLQNRNLTKFYAWELKIGGGITPIVACTPCTTATFLKAPKHWFTPSKNDTLNTYIFCNIALFWHTKLGFFFLCQILYSKRVIFFELFHTLNKDHVFHTLSIGMP